VCGIEGGGGGGEICLPFCCGCFYIDNYIVTHYGHREMHVVRWGGARNIRGSFVRAVQFVLNNSDSSNLF